MYCWAMHDQQATQHTRHSRVCGDAKLCSMAWLAGIGRHQAMHDRQARTGTKQCMRRLHNRERACSGQLSGMRMERKGQAHVFEPMAAFV